MRPRIVALKGPKNCGKTTTIGLSFEQLRQVARNVRHLRRRRKEVEAIIELDNVKVGWFSLGDLIAILKSGLDGLIAGKCEVIVCACRPHSKTSAYLQGLGFDVEWIEKESFPVGPERADQDRAKAEELVNAIHRAVEEVKEEQRLAHELATV